ncbi:hypothetical protein ETB97_009026 [Aspergillus alliaceus]|uniref:BZIP domain-containing protein n=1 Tax=Petromyces alliaceus TaxID=209559 RepID=A0A8H6AA56_PETAA|nr:hypothetical protein ETB97_009026 [Aspergillus burnettii]
MDDTLLSPESLDWASFLSQLESPSTPGPVSTPKGLLSGTESFPGTTVSSDLDILGETGTAQFEQLERILGSQTVANHVDFTADPTVLSAEAYNVSKASSDAASLMVEPTEQLPPVRTPNAQQIPTKAAFEKSIEVTQLRKKYHEKYKERNRLAAGRSRQKQVDLIELLEAERREEERRRKALEEEIQHIQKELLAMKEELRHHIRISNCISMMSHGAHLQTLGFLAHDMMR